MTAGTTASSASQSVKNLLEDAALKQVIEGMQTLPSLPTLYKKLTDELHSDDASVDRVAAIVSQDISMSAKILQVVNSPFYGLRTQVTNPTQAVALLGLNSIKSLVLSTKVFAQFDQSKLPFFSIDVLWRHGMAVGATSKAITREERMDREAQEDAFTAGLLHDIGILILATNFPGKYTEVLALMQEKNNQDWEAELAVVGTTHAEIGGYVLANWGLSENTVEAVGYHHDPSKCTSGIINPLLAVHVANSVEEEQEAESSGRPATPTDAACLEACNLSDRLPVWRAICHDARNRRA